MRRSMLLISLHVLLTDYYLSENRPVTEPTERRKAIVKSKNPQTRTLDLDTLPVYVSSGGPVAGPSTGTGA